MDALYRNGVVPDVEGVPRRVSASSISVEMDNVDVDELIVTCPNNL